MTRAELLSAVAQKTGLNRETVKDLFKKGWTYSEKLNEPARFEHPISQMKRN